MSPKKLLELINEFGKVSGYKISVQKSVTFLYTNNELSERETKKTIPFIITSKRIKRKNKQTGLYQTKKFFAQGRKLSTKRKGHILNGRRYLQMIYLIRG